MFFFRRKREPEPKRVDRVGAFCAIVGEAVDNATGPGASWPERVRFASF